MSTQDTKHITYENAVYGVVVGEELLFFLLPFLFESILELCFLVDHNTHVAESSRFQETVGKQILEKRAIEFEITYGDRGFR